MRKTMTPFKPAKATPPNQKELEAFAKTSGHTAEELHRMVGDQLNVPTFSNNRYTVMKRVTDGILGPMWHLSIRRNDRKEVSDWADFQQIKNELCGATHEGVELYPSETRRQDFQGQYHLYVFMDPTKIFPLGVVSSHTKK